MRVKGPKDLKPNPDVAKTLTKDKGYYTGTAWVGGKKRKVSIPIKGESEDVKEETDGMKRIIESAKKGQLHPKHIHVHPVGKNQFKVHSKGSKVESHIKHGMTVSSGDLDDFTQSGYKVKETKKP